MLESLNDLTRYRLRAADGEIGKVDRVLFDDEFWTVRYLVANTDGWLGGRLVLVSPISLERADRAERRVDVRLTRREVEESPEIDTRRPVSRQSEEHLFRHYGYSPYWEGPHLWGGGIFPAPAGPRAPMDPALAVHSPALDVDPPQGAPPAERIHLRGADEILGYAIDARDGRIGRLEDLLVEDGTWSIRYMVVRTSDWWPGRKVLVAPGWIRSIRWDESRGEVDLARRTIQGGPEYRAGMLLDREVERAIHTHYGKPAYWERAARSRA